MSTWSNEILLHRQSLVSEIQDVARRREYLLDFWCANSGTLLSFEPVFVIKFFRQEWRAYNFDTKLRINSLNKINDAGAEAE